ncbi:hypothetical protein R1sor_018103 [Riccia sorocarpa]|uniref:DUF4283 domain-containing protein n=1 Tax=Riccia sorocarpa TaxID=122646 RepID=A0ABD3I9T8_9MARC
MTSNESQRKAHENPTNNMPKEVDRLATFRSIEALPQPEGRTDRAKRTNPWRDTMCKWVQEHFVTKLGVSVTRLKVLDKSHYMVVFAKEEDRAKVFASTPFQLNQKHVQVSPWSTDYDTNNFKVRLKPVWVSILGLNPLFESLGKDILQSLGKVIHMTGEDNLGRTKFADVRALML